MAYAFRSFPALISLCLLPALAVGHPGHDSTMTFADGFAHPLTGLDHTLAMLAVGLWAGHLGRRAAWMLSATFSLAMLAGAAFAASSFALPAIEPAIALSVVTLGCLIALRARVHQGFGVALVGCFAIFHGYAHASEAAGGITPPYVAGFVGATITLHVIGIAFMTRVLNRHPRTMRIAGSLIGASGATLLFVA